MNLLDLKKKDPEELLKQAIELDVENPSSYRKQDLIFAILKKIALNGSSITGSGVIEVIQDGFLLYDRLLRPALVGVVGEEKEKSKSKDEKNKNKK